MQTLVNQLRHIKEVTSGFLKRLSWLDILILGLLLLFEVSMHPLGIGPDRRIHDPGVARFIDPQSFPRDWYANSVEESGVYSFYGPLVALGPILSIDEERWRMMLYIGSLIILYGSLIRIARVFTKSPLVVPFIALFHAIGYLYSPPAWLYGPFIHIDGGLAPRSIGVALSFLSLAFILEKKPVAPWVVLGIATLFHVSNSLLVFLVIVSSMLVIWTVEALRNESIQYWRRGIKYIFSRLVTASWWYIVAGGWFVFAVAWRDTSGSSIVMTTEQFIWTWVYFRAPYMALTHVSFGSWMLFFLHVGLTVFCALLLSRIFLDKQREVIILTLTAGFSLAGFGVFYFFTFIFPWLPGFQLYSFRVIYLVYFVAYFLLALLITSLPRYLLQRLLVVQPRKIRTLMLVYYSGVMIGLILFIKEEHIDDRYLKNATGNLEKSAIYLRSSPVVRSGSSIENFLLAHRNQAYLAPPDWYGPAQYTSHVASFKVFGFTQASLPVWYERMDTLSRGKLSNIYSRQLKQDQWEPISIKWKESYGTFTNSEIQDLKQKYNFDYFVTYSDLQYDFPVLMKEEKYTLYSMQ